MKRSLCLVTWITAGWAALPATAQDSVSKIGCMPGDCVVPWDDATAPTGTEQVNRYVIDLAAFNTSWGTTFGVAPLAKSSRTAPQFTGSLLSGQGISRRALRDQPFPSASYQYWTTPGAGIANDPSINDPAGTIAPPASLGTQQFAAFSEFSTTGGGASYNGMISTQINIADVAPARLFVTRTVAAVNGCDTFSNSSQFGMGSIDAKGNLIFRADDFALSGSNCPGIVNLFDDNIFKVAVTQRNDNILNVVSNDWLAGGAFDKGSGPNFVTDWLVRNNVTVTSPPGIAATTSGAPLFIGTDQAAGYVRGTAFGSIVTDASHFAPGAVNHRGNISYTPKNHASVASTNGICAIVGYDANNKASLMNLWGIDGAGNVTGKLGLVRPATITDNATGATNLAGTNEFDNWGSQVGFRGGNGQVSLAVDQGGNLLAAAMLSHPNKVGSNTGTNYIAVAKVTPAGAVSWTMASYNDGTTGPTGTGKPVLDGSGNIIGRLVGTTDLTGGTLLGPSCSSPMLDSAGNVWFLGVWENLTNPNDPFDSALFRAVYDRPTFSYRLELVMSTGKVFRGHNSGRKYQLTFLEIADSNSASSAAPYSQNISADGWLGRTYPNHPTKSPVHLGGIVINAGIRYDWNDDGTFDNCSTVLTSKDESYNALLYIGYPGFHIASGGAHGVTVHQ
ncbi:MAG: hypothetical protein L6Q99_18425 [Planctomycetes bacterium]|nr:hypothetical protein [Planctomycetota bacterium]